MRTWKDLLKSGTHLAKLDIKNVNPEIKFLTEVIYLGLNIRNQAREQKKGDRERETPLWCIHHGRLGKHQEIECAPR